MENRRVRIADIAEELGVSTATVSNVIHGKTKKISDETVKRVQKLLEERQYIPSMAGILLAQNDSRIIGVIINDHEKYEGHVLEDPFVASSLNALLSEIEKAGCFMMVKAEKETSKIVQFASMWNLDGIVLIGFCEQDYKKLREAMHIPFVVYDGFSEEIDRICNLTIDNFDGGRQMGQHFKELGHKKALCIMDNRICMDEERYLGFEEGFAPGEAEPMLVPMAGKERHRFYRENLSRMKAYTAVFAASDYYAVDVMQFLMEQGVRIPEDISVAGFDDNPICEQIVPSLTTVRQDASVRAKQAITVLKELKQGKQGGMTITLPVTLIRRHSTAKCTK